MFNAEYDWKRALDRCNLQIQFTHNTALKILSLVKTESSPSGNDPQVT